MNSGSLPSNERGKNPNLGDETTGSVGLQQEMNHLSGFVFGLLVVFIPCSWGYPEVSLISHLPKFDQIVQFFVDELRRQ